MDSKQQLAYRLLNETLAACRAAKPNDRSTQDRAFAVIITDLEKTVAYMDYWVNGNGSGNKRELP